MAEKDLYESLPFLIADLLILTKMDLLPHLRFDLELCRDYIRRVNPGLRVIETSVYGQQELEDWFEYLRGKALSLRGN